MRSRHAECSVPSQCTAFSVHACCSCFCVMTPVSHVSLRGRHALPLGGDPACQEKPGEPLRGPGQGRAGQPGPMVLEAAPAGRSAGP